MLPSLHLPLLLPEHLLDYRQALNARATTITVILTQIMAARPIPHGGINE